METEARVWAGAGILVALAPAMVAIWVTLEIFESGGSPEKNVEIDTIGPFDPMSDLSALAGETTLELTIGDSSYDNIVIWRFSLRNKGKTPIIPDDFVKPLQVSVDPPWEIIAIKDSYDFDHVKLKWDGLLSARAVSEPFLLNPGDSVSQTVYITAKQPTSVEGTLDITARVVNLKRFVPAKSFLDSPQSVAIVSLSFTDALILVFTASLLLYWYAVMLHKSKIARFPSRNAFLLLVVAAAVCYSVAEVVTYYLSDGSPVERILGRRLWDWEYQIQNWVIVAAHLFFSFYLYRRSRNPE